MADDRWPVNLMVVGDQCVEIEKLRNVFYSFGDTRVFGVRGKSVAVRSQYLVCPPTVAYENPTLVNVHGIVVCLDMNNVVSLNRFHLVVDTLREWTQGCYIPVFLFGLRDGDPHHLCSIPAGAAEQQASILRWPFYEVHLTTHGVDDAFLKVIDNIVAQTFGESAVVEDKPAPKKQCPTITIPLTEWRDGQDRMYTVKANGIVKRVDPDEIAFFAFFWFMVGIFFTLVIRWLFF